MVETLLLLLLHAGVRYIKTLYLLAITHSDVDTFEVKFTIE